MFSCLPANSGSYVPSAGASRQTTCPPGRYTAGSGARACTACAAGTSRPVPESKPSFRDACSATPRGSRVDAAGRSRRRRGAVAPAPRGGRCDEGGVQHRRCGEMVAFGPGSSPSRARRRVCPRAAGRAPGRNRSGPRRAATPRDGRAGAAGRAPRRGRRPGRLVKIFLTRRSVSAQVPRGRRGRDGRGPVRAGPELHGRRGRVHGVPRGLPPARRGPDELLARGAGLLRRRGRRGRGDSVPGGSSVGLRGRGLRRVRCGPLSIR